MKFTPEVVAALEVLRAAAENDFERHRIDVLERDLHEPPQVEVIDDKHQKFCGVVYTRDGNGHFRSTFHIHRAVWTYCREEIADAHHVHHIDNNPANNKLDNLQCLTNAEHIRLHKGKGKPAALRTWNKELTCPTCGKIFQASESHRKYCSPECRRLSEYKLKHCAFCGKEFSTKHKDQKCCSIKCARKLRTNIPQKICPVCGKTFQSSKHYGNKKTCSRECGTKLMWQTRKNTK